VVVAVPLNAVFLLGGGATVFWISGRVQGRPLRRRSMLSLRNRPKN